MSMLVSKKYPTVEEARRVADWYARIDEDHRPRNVSQSQEWVAYDFVDGCYPSGWQAAGAAHDALKHHVWQLDYPGEYMCVDMEGYCNYVRGVADKIGLDVKKILLRLREEKVTLVKNCHGDATLSNMVQVRDQIVFIDPGHHRGLPCVELDESKMLQSLMGYDELKYVSKAMRFDRNDRPFKTRVVHVLLFATHCVRLIPHQRANGREDLVRWALYNVSYVAEAVSNTEWMKGLTNDT